MTENKELPEREALPVAVLDNQMKLSVYIGALNAAIIGVSSRVGADYYDNEAGEEEGYPAPMHTDPVQIVAIADEIAIAAVYKLGEHMAVASAVKEKIEKESKGPGIVTQ